MRSPGPMLRFAALPPPLSDNRLASPSPQIRHWNVTHACESATGLLPLVEAQSEIGMRPAILTADGWFHPGLNPAASPPVSLIYAWRGVRQWRTLFARQDVGRPGDILHAHCFGAAMAGIRAGNAVVYDIAAPLGAAPPRPGPWLLRSLRVAESFVLSRASAVVVHTQSIWSWALEQGTRAEDLFLIPGPLSLPVLLFDETPWLSRTCRTRPAVTLFAPYCPVIPSEDVSPSRGTLCLLRAFAVLSGENDNAHLLLEADNSSFMSEQAKTLGLADRVHVISAADRARALASCDIVIAADAAASLDALAHGRALLAADIAANREVSPDGRGCLWYAPGAERDLANRASFLARNPDFRSALGAAGRAHLQATRSPSVVARRYDDVYRHALQRHRFGDDSDAFHHVPALAAC